MKEYLLNLGFCYCVVIPDLKKCYVLNTGSSSHPDIQAFLEGKEMDYSAYPSTWFPYDENETWVNYQESGSAKTYRMGADLGEEEFINRHVMKKYTDGHLVAIRDPNRPKVKVYIRKLPLHHELNHPG